MQDNSRSSKNEDIFNDANGHFGSDEEKSASYLPPPPPPQERSADVVPATNRVALGKEDSFSSPQSLDDILGDIDGKEKSEQSALSSPGEPMHSDIFEEDTTTPPPPQAEPREVSRGPIATPPFSEEGASEGHFSWKVIVLSLVGFIVIAIGSFAGYVVYTGKYELFSFLTSEENAEVANVTSTPQEEVVTPDTPVDTSAWKSYTYEAFNITFKYPGDLLVVTDALPNSLETATNTETYLLLEDEKKTKEFVFWAHPNGLAAFSLPLTGEFNPLLSTSQLIVKAQDDTLVVSRTINQSYSALAQPNQDIVIAYTQELIGGARFIFFYKDTENSNREKILQAIVESSIISSDPLAVQDSDGDGLTNDEEEKYGTDKANRDSDGDGYDDGTEVNSGFNPLGEGKLGT